MIKTNLKEIVQAFKILGSVFPEKINDPETRINLWKTLVVLKKVLTGIKETSKDTDEVNLDIPKFKVDKIIPGFPGTYIDLLKIDWIWQQ